MEAWRNFSRTTLKEGALPKKTKQLIAIAVAHVTNALIVSKDMPHRP